MENYLRKVKMSDNDNSMKENGKERRKSWEEGLKAEKTCSEFIF